MQLTLDKVHKCIEEHLIAFADHFEGLVPQEFRKQIIKSELWSTLLLKGILPCEPAVREIKDGSLSLKELELETCCLDLKERELLNELEV